MATKDADLNNDGTITKREMNSYNEKNPNSPVSNKDRQAYNQRQKDKTKTNPASEFNLEGLDPGTLSPNGAQIVISGFGAKETFNDAVPGTSFGGSVTQYGDLTINSASKLKYLFVALRQDNDPRLKAWYKQAGFSNWDDAKKVWDKAADYAYKLAMGRATAGNSKNVDFFQLMGSKKFLNTLSGTGTSAPAGPMVYTTLTDPATARADLIKMMKSVAGRAPTDKEINEYIKKLNAAQRKAKTTVFQGQTVQSRFDEEEFLMNFVVGKTDFAGSLKPGMARQALDTLTMTISAFGVGSYVTADKKNKWAKQLLTGEMTQEELGQRLSEIAAKAFPAFADVISSNPGVNMRELFDDYIGTYANMLELDFDTVDIKEVLGKAGGLNPDGSSKPMSLFEFEKSLRKDARFAYTKLAHQEAASLGASMARSFGVNI